MRQLHVGSSLCCSVAVTPARNTRVGLVQTAESVNKVIRKEEGGGVRNQSVFDLDALQFATS